MIKYPIIFIALLSLLSSCQETSSVGSDLLNDEKFDVQFTDDFQLNSETVLVDKVISYQSAISLKSYSVGELQDPIFGDKKCDVFFQVIFNNSIDLPNFTDATLDSMVLVMTYDTIANYGDVNATHNLELYPYITDLDDRDTIYSDEDVEYVNRLIGTKSFVANTLDSINITNHLDSTDLLLAPQIRITLDEDWSNELFTTSELYESSENLEEFMRGMYLRNTPSSNALLGLNLSSTASSDSGLNRLTVYYKDSLGVNRIYAFRLSTKRGVLVDVDRSGTLANEIIERDVDNDSLTIIESHTPYNTKVTFNDLSFLENKIINHARLKVYVADIPNDDLTLYPAIYQLLASKYNDEGNLEFIDDIFDLTVVGTTLDEGFGGSLTAEDGKLVYNLNITKHLKDILDQDVDERKAEIYLSPLSRIQIPNRSVLYGAKNSNGPMKLEVAFTEL